MTAAEKKQELNIFRFVKTATQRAIITAAAMPSVLRIVGIFSILFTLAVPLVLIIATLSAGKYHIGGKIVTPDEWLRIGAPVFIISGLLVAAFGYSLWTERPWSRHVLTILWLTIVIYLFVLINIGVLWLNEVKTILIKDLLLCFLSTWYLYRKPNVVEYFGAIRN